jgi:DNA-binding GntR family transcriptional regulator
MTNKEEAYLFIKQQILSGKFKPGQILSENQMRIVLDMSRTPIREAFKELEGEGLLVTKNQLVQVTKITFAELKDNYELRSLLENYALAKNFDQIDRAKLNRFIPRLQKIYAEQSWSDYLQADRELHQLLTNCNQNPTMNKVMEILNNQTDRMRFLIADNQHCVKSSIKELLTIIQAVSDHDLAGAQAALKKHIQAVYQWEVADLSD